VDFDNLSDLDSDSDNESGSAAADGSPSSSSEEIKERDTTHAASSENDSDSKQLSEQCDKSEIGVIKSESVPETGHGSSGLKDTDKVEGVIKVKEENTAEIKVWIEMCL